MAHFSLKIAPEPISIRTDDTRALAVDIQCTVKYVARRSERACVRSI